MSSSTAALAEYFRHQAEWRDAKADEYPDDERNAQSAKALYSLAEYVESDERAERQVEALDPHLFEEFILGGEEAQREVSRYGFGYNATIAGQHEELLENLWVACMKDAYEAVSEGRGERAEPGEEDPTGELLPFEIDAAKDGVHLPRYYWQRRRMSMDYELEDWVKSYRGEEVS